MSSPSRGEAEPYGVPGSRGHGELREKGSRFLALVIPATSEDEIGSQLEQLRREYRGATHVCWAWRLGAAVRERSSDAGEPAGTAGVPILQVLRGEELSDVLVAVVRWYGGTKLGKGGLARAYAAAARAALETIGREERVATGIFELSLPYPRLGAVKHLLDGPGCRLISESYGETVQLRISVELPRAARFKEAVAELGPAISCVSRDTVPG